MSGGLRLRSAYRLSPAVTFSQLPPSGTAAVIPGSRSDTAHVVRSWVCDSGYRTAGSTCPGAGICQSLPPMRCHERYTVCNSAPLDTGPMLRSLGYWPQCFAPFDTDPNASNTDPNALSSRLRLPATSFNGCLLSDTSSAVVRILATSSLRYWRRGFLVDLISGRRKFQRSRCSKLQGGGY